MTNQDRVWSVTKTKQGNDMIDCIGVVYTKNENESSWSIESGAIFDENQIWKWCDWSYKSSLCRKQNWIVMIDWTECWLW